MASTNQAKKRAKQALANREHNFALRTQFRTVIKKVLKAVQSGDQEHARSQFIAAQSTIDRIARKGIFHVNKAARHKSRLSAKVKAMSASTN